MSRLKGYILLLVGWFFVFYNVERLIAPINLASFVYALATVYALLAISLASLKRIPVGWVFLAGLVPYLVLKALLQSPIAGMQLPLTVTEIVSIAITVYLAHQIGTRISDLNREIVQLAVGPTSQTAQPFSSAQAECYREIRRARHYNRPAAVLSIAPVMGSVDISAGRLPGNAEQNLVRQYISARTADLLRKLLKESDIVTMRNSHFLVLLPETEGKHLKGIITRLEASAQEKLGIALKVGSSTFPDEAVTFESLVEYAEKRMKAHEPAARDAVASAQPGHAAPRAAVETQTAKEIKKADLGIEQPASH